MPHNVDLIWRIFYELQQLTVVVAKNATTDSASGSPDSKTLRMCLEMVDLSRWNSSAIFWLAVMVFIMIPSASKCARNAFAPSDQLPNPFLRNSLSPRCIMPSWSLLLTRGVIEITYFG